MTGIGPFSFEVIVVFVAMLVGMATAKVLARRCPDVSSKAVDDTSFKAVLWGAVVARLAFVALWWNEYSSAPMSVLAIGDGGFSWWAGVLAASAAVLWITRHKPVLRRPVLISIAAGVLTWLAASNTLAQLRPAPPLPALALATLDGHAVTLNTAYAGHPVVLNLWASWCPPCRREMPVFHQAQAVFPDVAFVMVNQGETAQQAHSFLNRERLAFKDLLLDPSSKAMRALGTQGLPTTLFFDAQGRLVDRHLGELTMASLKSTLSRRLSSSNPSNIDTK